MGLSHQTHAGKWGPVLTNQCEKRREFRRKTVSSAPDKKALTTFKFPDVDLSIARRTVRPPDKSRISVNPKTLNPQNPQTPVLKTPFKTTNATTISHHEGY